MIKDFCLALEKNKDKVKEYFRTTPQSEYDSYELLVRRLFDIVINSEYEKEHEKYDTKNILVIDDGEYQGTEIYLLHKKTYQPDVEDYIYTSTYYGSCDVCDTLLSISDCSYDLPNEEQVSDYINLCLHLLQKCHIMFGENY